MQPQIAFCSRCRGMRVGWNQRYVLHSLRCRQWRRHSSRLFGLMFLTAVVFLAFPQPSKTVDSIDEATALPEQEAIVQNKVVQVSGPVVRSIEAFLTAHKIPGADLKRLAQAIVAGAKKHDLDPRLIASVVIVESRGNPFAISGKDAIGVMQIHLPTWGQTADQEVSNDTTAFSSTIRFRRVPLRNTSPRFNAFTNSGPKTDPSILSQCLLRMDFRGAAGGNHRRRNCCTEKCGRN